MDNKKWIQGLAAEVKERREKERVRRDKFTTERDFIKSRTPELWSEIRTCLKAKIEALNEALGEDVVAWEVLRKPKLL